MKVLPLFYANLYTKEPVVVNQGGTSSGKTFSILQVLHYIATRRKLRITVAGMSVPHLKQGAYADFKRILSDNPEMERFISDHNKTDRKFTYFNGSYIEFSSFENEMKARGPRRDILYINECNGISYEIYWQLKFRTEIKTFLDYNPTAKFWVHEKLIGKRGVKLIISDHRKNYFLTEDRHLEIESIPDRELFKVYARGLTGVIKGLIYPYFEIIPAIPHTIQTVAGLDFGYAHMTALIEVGHQPGRLFWNEMIYQSGLTIGDLIPLMQEIDLKRKRIYADHAAADKIEDLQRAKFNVIKADKDVANGIDYVKRHTLYITENSSGILKEIKSYKWKTLLLPSGEEVETGDPVKFKDDAMDAGRYGSYSNRKGAKIHIANEGRISDGDRFNDMLNDLK